MRFHCELARKSVRIGERHPAQSAIPDVKEPKRKRGVIAAKANTFFLPDLFYKYLRLRDCALLSVKKTRRPEDVKELACVRCISAPLGVLYPK